MKRQFVNDVGGKFKVPLKDDNDKTVAYLLWGDSVRIQEKSGEWAKVKAREQQGWVPQSVLTDDGLLEVYVIDVGQGDGVLMRTPDDVWHLVDAGVANEKQMTKKGAANFIRWKFLEDLGRKTVSLRNVIVSHPDFDHYGGMLDLLTGTVMRPERTFPVEVENFYHSGMGRFASSPKLGKLVKGSVADLPYDDYGITTDDQFITELRDGKSSFAHREQSPIAYLLRFAIIAGWVAPQILTERFGVTRQQTSGALSLVSVRRADAVAWHAIPTVKALVDLKPCLAFPGERRSDQVERVGPMVDSESSIRSHACSAAVAIQGSAARSASRLSEYAIRSINSNSHYGRL